MNSPRRSAIILYWGGASLTMIALLLKITVAEVEALLFARVPA